MNCAWNELLEILPVWLRQEVDRPERTAINEIRLRCGMPAELVIGNRSIWLCRNLCDADIAFCVNTASRYSPWTVPTSARGFITAPGGHRIGLCGEAVMKNGIMEGIKNIKSISIRIARDYEGIGKQVSKQVGSILIIGAPGCGKTTLLRDVARTLSQTHNVCVVDERGELFPLGIQRGKKMDVLSGCPKSIGAEILIRTMCPKYVAVDEITSPGDTEALLCAAYCGVKLLATAHASDLNEFFSRKIYKPLIQNSVFDWIVLLHEDKSYSIERMKK